MSEEKDKDIRLFKEAQTRGNLGFKVAELEKTQITKVFYEQWVDKLTALNKEIEELKDQIAVINVLANAKAVIVPEGKGIFWTNKIEELKLNQTDGTPNQNFIAIRILKDGMNTIGIKIENRFNKIESILREQFCETFLKIMSEDFELRKDKERKEITDNVIKEIIDKLDGEKSGRLLDGKEWYSAGLEVGMKLGKELSDEKPLSICTLKEQRECYSYKTMLCLSPKITTCMHGKTKLEKEKPSEPSDDEAFIFSSERDMKLAQAMNNRLIAKFLDWLENHKKVQKERRDICLMNYRNMKAEGNMPFAQFWWNKTNIYDVIMKEIDKEIEKWQKKRNEH